MMEHTCVENMMTLLKPQPLKSPLPSEPDAVVPSSTANATESSNFVLLALLDGLLGEIVSPDSAYLAMSRALQSCREAGVPDAVFKETMQKVGAIWNEKRKRNPISLLFQ